MFIFITQQNLLARLSILRVENETRQTVENKSEESIHWIQHVDYVIAYEHDITVLGWSEADCIFWKLGLGRFKSGD